jgi:aminocarboxymuconate-semialdehyde decarboxylase
MANTDSTRSIDRASLHRCRPAAAPVTRGTPIARLPYLTIDVHCHLFSPEVERMTANHPRKTAEAAASLQALGPESVSLNIALAQRLTPQFVDVNHRLQDMDAMGVDIQAISPSPTQYYYWAEPDLSDEIVASQNNQIAVMCAAHPRRFVAFGTVALQDPMRAAEQLKVLICDRGFKGVQISTLVNGRDIAERLYDPFWQMAEELGAVVFIHPWGSTFGPRLADYYLMNLIGQPLEHAVCLSKLIFGGTFDRHPRLKVLAGHGGGYLPTYVQRSDHGHAVRPEAAGCRCRPTDYLKRIWFDSIVYESDALARLIDVVGRGRVVVGTDYPYDMGHYDPSGLLRPFEEETQRMILGTNAAALLELPLP